MSRLLIISHDVIGERMAGVGIRYYEVARALAQDSNLQVTLAAPAASVLPPSLGDFGGRFMVYSPQDVSTLDDAIRDCDVLLAYPDMIWQCRAALERWNKPVVVDGYDITLLEHLELDAASKALDERLRWQADYQGMMRYVLARGDFFVAATERQRDWWLGALASAGRINPLTYEAGPSLRQLVDLLPYGLPQSKPARTRSVMRGVIEGINPDDKIVLWGGGVWEWLDPLTLIRAAAQIAARRPDVKFVFPGMRHPANSAAQTMSVQQEATDLAQSLGLLGRVVFMGDWAAYEAWPNYLLESDIGVSLHRDHLEARFSARTRVLSYLWAGLPMVLTRGDDLAERMAQAGMAVLVEEENADAVATAIEALLTHPRGAFGADLDALQSAFHWPRVVEALRAFCLRPACAPDRLRSPMPAAAEPHTPAQDRPITHEQADATQAPIDDTMKDSSAPPDLQLPAPVSFVGRMLAPLLDALVFWRLRTMIWQQNQINRVMAGNLIDVQQYMQAAVTDLASQQRHMQAAVMDLASQQRHMQAAVTDLASQLRQYMQATVEEMVGQQRQYTQATVEEIVGQQRQYTQTAVAGLAGQLQASQSNLQQLQAACDALKHQALYDLLPAIEQLNARLADAEHLQTDLIAEIAKQT